MIDPTAMSISAITAHSPASIVLVFAAGVLTSFGPCVAPRYIAVTAIANATRRPTVTIAAFLCGLVGAYVALGFAAGLIGSLWSLSSVIDGVLAATLLFGGAMTLIRARTHQHHEQSCSPNDSQARSDGSFGGTALVGAATALVISPCCAPIVVAIVATSTAVGKPAMGAALLAVFALGHALPLLFSGAFSSLLMRRFARLTTAQAPAIIAGSLLLALGCYYAVLV
jgi:cytochrome c biogenesis protein CcdA